MVTFWTEKILYMLSGVDIRGGEKGRLLGPPFESFALSFCIVLLIRL